LLSNGCCVCGAFAADDGEKNAFAAFVRKTDHAFAALLRRTDDADALFVVVVVVVVAVVVVVLVVVVGLAGGWAGAEGALVAHRHHLACIGSSP